MNVDDLNGLLQFARRKTLDMLDAIATRPDPARVLAWRPGPGRAHLAWQMMHIAATDDRHLNVRMNPGTPVREDFVKRFAGGSTPDDDIPTLAEIRDYLTQRRDALTAHLLTLTPEQLRTKPNAQAQWNYEEWFRLLAWHEGHHHGQCQLTLNLYRAQVEPETGKTGH